MFLKNKLIPVLLILLVVANIITIAMYWQSRKKPLLFLPQDQQKHGSPSEFLIKSLSLDSNQQVKYLDLVKTHQMQTKDLREKTMAAKDHFFDLIKQPALNDSIAKNSVSQISLLTAQQDMVTLQHFRQVRALCNTTQQQKFDSIIHQMLGIMANQRPNMPPPTKDGNDKQPPPDDKQPPSNQDNHRLPPPDRHGPPPDRHRPPPDGQGPPPDGPPPPQHSEGPPPDGPPPPPNKKGPPTN